MSERRTKFDPFSNKGTSGVFYRLISGCKTTKEISNILKIRSPSVIEHLRRLQEIGVVRLGEKKGKFQEYQIDFEEFLTLFIDRAIQEKKTHPSSIYKGEIDQLRILKNNRYFKEFIVKYLKDLDNIATIDEAAKEFENGLMRAKNLGRKRKFDDDEKQQFFEKMRLWKMATEKKYTFVELNFQDALAKTLDPERFEDN